MAEFRWYLASLLADHIDARYDPEHREFIEDVADALYERHENFPRWPESVRHFYACYDLNWQVLNGGWAQAAYNVPGLISVAGKAFERFGRPAAAELCRRALSMLPAEVAAHVAKGFTGRESLEEVFEHFDDSAMAELDADVTSEFYADDKLQELVELHRSDFESVDRLS